MNIRKKLRQKNYSSHFFLIYPHPRVNKSIHKNTFTMCHRILNIGKSLSTYKTKITRKKTIPINHPPAETWCGYVVRKKNFIILISMNLRKKPCLKKKLQNKKKIGFRKKKVYISSIKKGWSGEEKRGLCPPHHSTHYTLIPHTLNST